MEEICKEFNSKFEMVGKLTFGGTCGLMEMSLWRTNACSWCDFVFNDGRNTVGDVVSYCRRMWNEVLDAQDSQGSVAGSVPSEVVV
ncbi:hypothetical protein V6N12_068376 [Hibiscus sabdariffa]|uniref:Uncharacterized protein n=1 Tax=Hibiscus sabdariffa TaxID=183260 RepID=A0ABR2FPT9_9ROSI